MKVYLAGMTNMFVNLYKQNKKRIIITTVLIILLISIVFPTSVYAIANPDSITMHTSKVFQGIFESGDLLFVASEDVAYASEPTENAEYTFSLNLLDESNNLIASRPLNYYQYNVHSIYLTAAQVTSLGLVYGSAYKLRVTGNPAFFSTLTENVNIDTQILASSDWNTDGTYTAKYLLMLHCIDIAEALESDWSITLITTTSEGNSVLNSTGGVVFLDAIPSLNNAIPDLFQITTSVIGVDQTSGSAVLSANSTLEKRLGTSIANAFDGIGDFFGFGQQISAGMWIMLFALTITSIVFLNSGNSAGAMVLTIPVIMMGTYLGAIPVGITFTVGLFIIAYMFYFIWLRGT